MILSTIVAIAGLSLEPNLPVVEERGRAVRSAPKRSTAKSTPKKKKVVSEKPVAKKTAKKEEPKKEAQQATSSGPGFLGTMAAAAAGSYVGSAIANHFDGEEEDAKESTEEEVLD